MNKQNELTKFYLRRKINLLAEYLGRRDDLPASLHDPDALYSVDEDWDETTQSIGIHEGSTAGSEEAEEHDPIYSEGWTIGPVGRPRQLEQDSPADKQQAEEEKSSDKQD